MLFKMLVWSLLVSMLRLCSLNAQSQTQKQVNRFCLLCFLGVANGKIRDSPRRRDWHLKIQARDEKV